MKKPYRVGEHIGKYIHDQSLDYKKHLQLKSRHNMDKLFEQLYFQKRHIHPVSTGQFTPQLSHRENKCHYGK